MGGAARKRGFGPLPGSGPPFWRQLYTVHDPPPQSRIASSALGTPLQSSDCAGPLPPSAPTQGQLICQFFLQSFSFHLRTTTVPSLGRKVPQSHKVVKPGVELCVQPPYCGRHATPWSSRASAHRLIKDHRTTTQAKASPSKEPPKPIRQKNCPSFSPRYGSV